MHFGGDLCRQESIFYDFEIIIDDSVVQIFSRKKLLNILLTELQILCTIIVWVDPDFSL